MKKESREVSDLSPEAPAGTQRRGIFRSLGLLSRTGSGAGLVLNPTFIS